jgi:hypothetical protein
MGHARSETEVPIAMKQYNDPNGIRLVGKAWEIRRRLRVLAGGRKKLADYVRRHGGRNGGK